MTAVNGHFPSPAEQLLERLNEPRTAEALNRLLDHADLLAYSASSLDGFVRRGEQITDNLRDSIAEARHALPTTTWPDSQQLGQFVNQLPQLLELTNQLTTLSQQPEFARTLATLSNPATLNALDALLQRMDTLAFAVTSAEAFLARGEEIADNVRDSLNEARTAIAASNLDQYGLLTSFQRILPYIPRLVTVAPKFIEVIERLERVVSSPEFDALLNSGVFHADTVSVVGQAGDAFADSYAASKRSEQRLGVFGLLRALNDPDIQRVAALVVDFGKRFGKTIQ
jgi:hypothetical protein